jgi:hypothetical protein
MSDGKYTVVENPEGPVFIAVTTDSNPYRASSQPVNLETAVSLDRDASFVRFCCVLDGIIAFMNVVTFLSPVAMFPLLASVWGYHGARTYNYKMMVSFMVYQYIYSVARWGFLGYAIWHNFERETEDDYRYWLLLSLAPLLQSYITWRIQMFYNVLKNIYISTSAYSNV